jgi:glutathione synthase/RimK-type ligase-like ATP-grasp enzyme
MILLCGIPTEAPLALVIGAAEELGVEHVVFNQRESGTTGICLDLGNRYTGTIRIRGEGFALDKFTGAYMRLMDQNFLPENHGKGADLQSVQKSFFVHQTLSEWAEITTCRVMNRNSSMSSNMSKPYQAQLISRCGFLIPPTLVTNDVEEVLRFKKIHRRVIFKSISAERSIVRELSGVKLAELKKIRYLPTQFQAFVPGVNLRVHVVGSKIFVTRIETDAVDYRYAGTEASTVTMLPWQPPNGVTQRCLELSRNLGLPLCGIDLKLTPEGEYYCFEVNPSPGYSYYQERTGDKISHAIVRYLEGVD